MKPDTRLRLAMTAGMLVIVGALLWGVTINDPAPVRPGHNAVIACGEDGEVHVTVSGYGEGDYVLNDDDPHFTGGFTLTLDGAKAWTLTVTADDWPTFTGAAGPCRQATTTTKETTTSTTTTAPSATTTTSVPTDSTSPSTSSSTTSSAPSTTSVTSSVPPPSSQPPASSTSVVSPTSAPTRTSVRLPVTE